MELEKDAFLKASLENLMRVHLKKQYSGNCKVFFGPVTDGGKTFKVYFELDYPIRFIDMKKSVDQEAAALPYTVELDTSQYFAPIGHVHFFLKMK